MKGEGWKVKGEEGRMGRYWHPASSTPLPNKKA